MGTKIEQRVTYHQQLNKQLKKQKRRRIKRIKVYSCRIVFLCLLVFLLSGAIHLANIVLHKVESPVASDSKSKNTSIMRMNSSKNVLKNMDLLTQMGYDKTMLESLFELSTDDSNVIEILNHIKDYPEELLDLLSKNSETVDFVRNYPTLSITAKIREDIDISDLYTQGTIPFFLQWDTRWGYCQYGKNYIALAGCGPTCLSMVYVGLTGDTSKNPGIMSNFSAENGFLDSNNNTTWSLMTNGAQMLGLNSKEISLDENVMIRELAKGHPIILSMRPGDFTTSGHFIVISDYQDGKFVVHDPNSKIRSEQLWDYDTLSYQIKNLWSFSL